MSHSANNEKQVSGENSPVHTKYCIYYGGGVSSFPLTLVSGQFEEIDLSEGKKVTHPLFKFIEAHFEKWLEWQGEGNTEPFKMYTMGLEEYQGGTYLSRKGAIQDAIDVIGEYIEENFADYPAYITLTEKKLNQIDIESSYYD